MNPRILLLFLFSALLVAACNDECEDLNCREFNKVEFVFQSTGGSFNYLDDTDSVFYKPGVDSLVPPDFEVVTFPARSEIHTYNFSENGREIVNLALDPSYGAYLIRLGKRIDTVQVAFVNAQDECCKQAYLPKHVIYNGDTLCQNGCNEVLVLEFDSSSVL